MIETAGGGPVRDRGFTLVEMIVVVVLMGLVTAAVAFSAEIVLRTNEFNNDGMNKAAAERSLMTWLSRDLASVPADVLPVSPGPSDAGYSIVESAASCSTGSPSRFLVTALWRVRRSNGTERTYAVDYRIIDGAPVDGVPTVRVKRFTCERNGAVWSPTETLVLGGLFDVDQPGTPVTTSGGLVQIELNLLRTAATATPAPVSVEFAPLGVK